MRSLSKHGGCSQHYYAYDDYDYSLCTEGWWTILLSRVSIESADSVASVASIVSGVSLLSPLFVLWLCPSLPPSLRPTLLPFLDPPVSALPLFSSSYLRGSSCTPGPQMVAAQEDPAQIGSSAVGTTCQAAIPEKTESASSHQKT